ncbi:MAG TPA: ABC transporter ATP-binding protein [Planctomycetota bacterium]|nr:ABC transporter ATP-binding protein [Planctomycetota bacterium]
MTVPVLALQAVTKAYGEGDARVEVLHGLDLEVRQGEFVAIMGPSGSGKSTLLNILGCLDRPSGGAYLLDGEDVARFPDDKLSLIRNGRIGFIFQSYNLIAQLTVLENVKVPLLYRARGHGGGGAKRAEELLATVGLSHRLTHRPSQLSGGECQRVAIARALINDPILILADEPTGNLDSKTGAEVLALLEGLHREGRTIVLITHDAAVARRAGRTVRLQDGRLKEAS